MKRSSTWIENGWRQFRGGCAQLAPRVSSHGRPPATAAGVILVGLAAIGALGCSGLPTKMTAVSPSVPAQSTPIALEAALKTLQEKENQQRMLALASSPEMKAAQGQLVEGFVDGTLEALEGARAERLASTLGPLAGGVARSALDSTIDHALGKGGDVGASMATAMGEHVGPALQSVVQDDLGPGVIAVIGDPEFGNAMGAVARAMGREMVLGANEAMTQIQRESPKEDSLIGSVGKLADRGAHLAGTVSVLLGAAVLLLGVWVVRLLTAVKRHSAESERRASTVLLIREAIKASKGKPWSRELVDALEEQLGEDVAPSGSRRVAARP